MRAQAKSTTPWASLFFALLGLGWCGYVAFPTSNPAPCLTSGCALFRDARIAGLSLWWVGGAYFFLLAVLCLKGSRLPARILAWLALFVDTLLLLVMFVTAPCSQCLVAAAFIGLCYYTLKKNPVPEGWFLGLSMEVKSSLLLPVWFGLFLGNAALALNEQIPLYALGNTRASESEIRTKIYFSPSCGACREAVSHFGNSAILYPVMENEQDFASIIRLAALLKANMPVAEAVRHSLDQDEPVPPLPLHEQGILAVQLFRNKAALMRQGFRAVPLIQVNAWQSERPSSLEQRTPPAASQDSAPDQGALRSAESPDGSPSSGASPGFPEANGFAAPETMRPESAGQLPGFLADPDALEQCGGDNAKPCD